MDFRKVIQREAKKQGMSGYRLGQLSGLPIRTVQAYLAGATDLAGRRIEKLAAVLGLELKPARQRRTKA